MIIIRKEYYVCNIEQVVTFTELMFSTNISLNIISQNYSITVKLYKFSFTLASRVNVILVYTQKYTEHRYNIMQMRLTTLYQIIQSVLVKALQQYNKMTIFERNMQKSPYSFVTYQELDCIDSVQRRFTEICSTVRLKSPLGFVLFLSFSQVS